jgi:hypothetical protein
MMFFAANSAFAVKPGETVNPNGFPSGEHFNLNIHGKKLGFNCPEPFDASTECPDPSLVEDCNTHDGEYGKYVNEGTEEEPFWIWKYSGSLFIPEADAAKEIKILMESGKKGGRGKKNADLVNVLQVTDPCSADFDNDAAVIQLPPCEGGYDVYVRALAKPTDDPSLTIENVGLNFVEDGDGNILYFAGSVGDGYVETNTFTRTTKPKGKSVATNITPLFEFTGSVCYWFEGDCPDDPLDETDCLPQYLCCEEDIDGTLECTFDTNCGDWLQGEEVVGEETIYFCFLDDGTVNGEYDEGETRVDRVDTDGDEDVDGDDLCGGGTIAYCKNYENEWVFNIADFAQYFWDIDNNGLKLLQVRFYPKCNL